MGYLGNATKYQSFPVDYFNGTGSQTVFTLSNKPGVASALLVTVAGLKLKPNVDYTVADNILTFTSAPGAGTNNIEVLYLGIKADIGVPADGAITPSKLSIGAPNWDSSGKVTLATPPVVGSTAPAFSVYQSTPQSALTAATYVKLLFQTKEYDTTSAFDNITNHRFQPQVAGYYNICGNFAVGSTVQINCAIYKNGVVYKYGSSAASGSVTQVSSIVFLNGSTDYIELYGYTSTSLAPSSGIAYTWFNGCLIQRTA